jgi:cold shock CspA family protein
VSDAKIGTVASFDEAVGLGEIADSGGQDTFAFHCTQLVDGTRTIALGTKITYRAVPARHGRWEAVDVAALSGPDVAALSGPDVAALSGPDVAAVAGP